jgi:hypothetical protein
MQSNPSIDRPPFSLRDSFELDSTKVTVNSIPSMVRSHREQDDLFRCSIGAHVPYQTQSQYNLPVGHLATSPSAAFPYAKVNTSPSFYRPFDQHYSSSYNYNNYPSTMKLALPTPVSPVPVPAIPAYDNTNVCVNSTRRAKVNIPMKNKRQT